LEIEKFTAHDDEAFLKYLGEWKLMIGDTRKSSGKDAVVDFIMIKSFLTDAYPTLTLPEIKLAAKLSITGKLSVSPQLYNNQSFSVLYCTTVINSFLEYKKEQLEPVFKKWNTAPPPETEYTPEYKLELTKSLFTDEYAKFMETGVIDDPLNLCYRFLKRTNRINATILQDQIEPAKQYGKQMAELYLKAQETDLKSTIARDKGVKRDASGFTADGISIQGIEYRYARNYCVQEFFRKLKNIDDLVNSFTLAEHEPTVPEQKKGNSDQK